MPNERDKVLKLVTSQQAAVLRQENALAADVVRAYENARRDLLTRFNDEYGNLGSGAAQGSGPTPEQIRQLANNASLIRAIETRLNQLQAELQGVIREELANVSQSGFETAVQEILVMAEGLGVNFMQFAIDPLLELTIGPALDQVPDLTNTLRAQLTATLREMLASGDRFSDIVKAVFAKEQSIFRNGVISAELMIRRAVIQANNNSRILFYERAKQQIPGLKKQAVAAANSPDTTETCLRVHGQIQDIDKPFEIVGRPSFGNRQMQPPFHWNCRTSVAPYHPVFERTSSLTTADMIAAAQRELAKR